MTPETRDQQNLPTDSATPSNTNSVEVGDVEAALNDTQLLANNNETSERSSVKNRVPFKDRLVNRQDSNLSQKSGKGCNNNDRFVIPPHTKAPKDTLKAVYAAGKYKAGLRLDVLMVQSTMAGIFIAFAGQLYLSVGGGVLGAALFPGGLVAVILTSAELFTGDALIFVAAVLGQQVPLHRLLRNWSVSWCCNFLGSLLWAVFMGYLNNAVEDVHATELAIVVAEKKALDHLGAIFLKGIGANFLVCVAVWQATCAEDVAGKVLALWWPTASFIMLGFSHCVANMFLIPMGMMLGADISVGRMFASLFMATLGNAVGGGVFVGAVYWYVFDSMASFGGLTSRIRQNLRNAAATRAFPRGGSGISGEVAGQITPHPTTGQNTPPRIQVIEQSA